MATVIGFLDMLKITFSSAGWFPKGYRLPIMKFVSPTYGSFRKLFALKIFWRKSWWHTIGYLNSILNFQNTDTTLGMLQDLIFGYIF